MAEEKVSMPQSGGGLLRYDSETRSKIVMTPTTVVILIIIVIFVSTLLHTRAFGLL
jgi:preprotein translocase subunit Sec61beta